MHHRNYINKSSNGEKDIFSGVIFTSCLPKTEINTITLTVLSAKIIRGCVEYSNSNTQIK